MIASIRSVLAQFAANMAPWSKVEQTLANTIPECQIFLGGDGLRPYAAWDDRNRIHFVGVQPPSLSRPSLIEEVLSGTYGIPNVSRNQEKHEIFEISIDRSEELLRRLDVPELLMIGLGDADRYRGARLPLGIARLSQWIRYTHSARVTVIDYNFTDEPLETVESALACTKFDILGVSVNFGQWEMLEELAEVVNRYHSGPVVLGNILAAFSPERATSLFQAAIKGTALVATSLGERPLEQLCREFRSPQRWPKIEGLLVPGGPPKEVVLPLRRIEPPELVFPDDELILAVTDRGGQIALETSFGCQYGACTFCPRDHRGDGWERGHQSAVVATLKRVAPTGATVSIVDEEFFGSEGLVDPPVESLPAEAILSACREQGIAYEVYTRLEQLFDRRRSAEWNLERARLLTNEASAMKRIFVGVESGSPSQLRRYGKGQTVSQMEDALRVGSALGVPLEFGFITFDPLLSPAELLENLMFLGRGDIICNPVKGNAEERVARVTEYLEGKDLEPTRRPLYQHVAYMATELEVLAHSRYADHLRRRFPDLLDGSYDAAFARHGVRYQDDRIAEIANICRVWTEGMFTPVYEARMTARSSGSKSTSRGAADLVAFYRDATFTLLVQATSAFFPELAGEIRTLPVQYELPKGTDPFEWLTELAGQILPVESDVKFDPGHLVQRRSK